MEDWDDGDGSWNSGAPEAVAEALLGRAEGVRKRFCACGHLVQARAVFSRADGVPRWTLVYSCTRGLSLEGHLHEEFDPLRLPPEQRVGFAPFFLEGEPDMGQLGERDRAARAALEGLGRRGAAGPAGPGGAASLARFGLSPAQVRNIVADSNLQRRLMRCPHCAEARPMIVWQLSAPGMEFCCICAACSRVFALTEVM